MPPYHHPYVALSICRSREREKERERERERFIDVKTIYNEKPTLRKWYVDSRGMSLDRS